ncbi:malonate decarboxylase holo-[acyl-carrier-protein] synthase [Rhizobium cauense]|uniref:malonate decarboxylase holo-[acyl-carrier-protein] synthase n=1 Tax=Rhizobium cauense TaxID=1166683 RepID=UPI001C6E4370|nr:malonate decarboxylase holo-[acyl-carrier-protein] synthase [Rhizobium cauense]MBW9116853.1 malonate decarboxylase holo-[acyl-carrier-protein] synthase [Rhizobium cauense]
MNSRSRGSAQPLKRHDLVVIAPLSSSADPILAAWIGNGWPLISRRPTPDDVGGVAVGLPLPPLQGKKRLSFVIRRDQIVSIRAPLLLSDVAHKAPSSWMPTINHIKRLASENGLDIGVFGSLAWSALTGLDYLTESSDLDLLLYVNAETNLDRVLGRLAQIQALAPMRLDGEFVREDGAAANWREFRSTAREVLIKSLDGACFIDRNKFLAGDVAK